MTILERVHDGALQAYAKLVMPSGNPGRRILVPLGAMGYGDLVFYLPVLRALDGMLMCDNMEKRTFLRAMGIEELFTSDLLPMCDFDTVVCHWLAQWTPIVKQIIAKRIPCRIGHTQDKRDWLWTHPIPRRDYWHYQTSNEALLEPFGLQPVTTLITVDNPIEADVLLVPYASDARRNWDLCKYRKLAKSLTDKGRNVQFIDSHWPIDRLIRTLAGARVVVGNDSGLPKIADAIHGRAIQIFRLNAQNGPGVCGLLRGPNLIDPSVSDVLNNIEGCAL